MDATQRFALDIKNPLSSESLSLAYCPDCRAQYQFSALTNPPLPRMCIICGQLLTVRPANSLNHQAR